MLVTPARIAGVQTAGMPISLYVYRNEIAIHGVWVPAIHAGTTVLCYAPK